MSLVCSFMQIYLWNDKIYVDNCISFIIRQLLLLAKTCNFKGITIFIWLKTRFEIMIKYFDVEWNFLPSSRKDANKNGLTQLEGISLKYN